MLAIVTGASGFIGRHLVLELNRNGYDVVAIVRDKESFRLPSSCDNCAQVNVIECDMNELRGLPEMLDHDAVDFFFHFAWSGVSGGAAKNSDIQLMNIANTIAALHVAAEIGSKRFIGAGSIMEVECLIEKEAEAKPRTTAIYKAAKLAAHYMVEEEAACLDIEILWPRITNAYGPGEMSPRLINSVIRMLQSDKTPKLTTGDQLYNFVFVDDCAKAFRLIAERGIAGERYVVGTPDIRPLRSYLEELQSIVNPSVPMGFGSHFAPATQLRYEDLYSPALYDSVGFAPDVSFAEGIERTAAAIMKNQE